MLKRRERSSISILFGSTLYNGHLRGPVTLTPVGSGADTTSFYDLGLSRPGIGLRSPACEAQHTRVYVRGVVKDLCGSLMLGSFDHVTRLPAAIV